ncbi:MAG: transporter substrate-binding domain-containing protein [Gammaproteobacteria bacterium]|nr:transporter substrate-binding domain-containing protein [Gammaproteobacteria bacterium]
MIKVLFVAIIFSLSSSVAMSSTFKIYMDESWYPYSFKKDNKHLGIHTDIIREAFKSLGYPLVIEARPWKRCLWDLEAGKADAIYPASYNEGRAAFSHYPPNAASTENSKWHMTKVEQVVATRKGTPYEFDGDISNIPQPVGVGAAGAVTDILEENGLKLYRNNSPQAVAGMLVKKRTNSLVMSSYQTEYFNSVGEYAGELKIHKLPIRTKPYFLIFSKNRTFPESESKRVEIWKAIAKVRENKVLMHSIFAKYIGD